MKIGVVGIIIEKDRIMVERVQKILSSFADVILSRTGLPDREREIYVISLIVRGSNERISALSGKLGRLNSVTVKTAVTELPTSSQDE